ncbi:hypothetical protein BT69DRAFT_1288241, partial [Atractiella rhizophila]
MCKPSCLPALLVAQLCLHCSPFCFIPIRPGRSSTSLSLVLILQFLSPNHSQG